ncbi:three-helix bundle dimerization domain-containing protein [Streptomyces canus]|uniref:three-helix bundle dimerization domain-containing protein n=1 Tax=Streptomyces canus TaxID=58343 RepID=UPI0036E121F9
MLIELGEDAAIRHVAEHLTVSHGASHTPDADKAAVASARATLKTVPVRSYVPVLVERRARRILSEHACGV